MKLKKIALLTFFLASILLMLAACNESNFSAAPGSVFQQCVNERPEVKCTPCVNTADGGSVCIDKYDYEVEIDEVKKDILFVVDNSGSMYREQQRMGSMFPNMMSYISNIDYRVAITTTDVESVGNPRDSVNQDGALQNGNLIPYEGGRYFLDGTIGLNEEQDLFEMAIAREETLTCEDNDYQEPFCPSGDERGLLAASMTLMNNPQDFIRSVGQMHLVILSDEDEGSTGTFADPKYEEPTNFVNNFKDYYPNKSLAVHSIVIQPDDSACLDEQREGGHPPGYYGEIYAELTSITGGVPGDICASDQNYAQQIQKIGESIARVREPLPCDPIDDKVEIDIYPDPGFNVTYTYNTAQNEIIVDQDLPGASRVRFQFECYNEERN